MLSRWLEDLKYLDAFHPPTMFEDTIDLYKEWHHFVFFHKGHELLGMLNFSVTGNPYNVKKGFATVIMVFTDSSLRWRGNVESFSIQSLRFSDLHPSIVLGGITVVYEDGLYQVFGKLRSQATMVDLRFKVDSLPATANQLMPLGALAPIWKDWVGMALAVDGTLFVEGEEFKISKGIGYHDHNRGRFKWGDPFSWDSGFLLEEVPLEKSGPMAIGFLADRSLDTEQRHAGVFLWTREGPKKTFSSDQIEIKESGIFEGAQRKLPGTARMLWPEQPRNVPSAIRVVANDHRDRVQIDFEPVSLCQIVSSNHLGEGKTIWNEIYAITRVRGVIDGETIWEKTSGYLESVRPAR